MQQTYELQRIWIELGGGEIINGLQQMHIWKVTENAYLEKIKFMVFSKCIFGMVYGKCIFGRKITSFFNAAQSSRNEMLFESSVSSSCKVS